MENEKQLAKFKNLIWVFAPALVVLTLFVSVQIRHVIIKEDNPCCLILCLTALYVILIGSVIVLLYLYNLRLKQLIDCQNLQIENDKKREYDKLQSQLNHEYRMAALESENLPTMATGPNTSSLNICICGFTPDITVGSKK